MKFNISTVNNGYVLAISKNVAGKGEQVQERLVFTTKEDLLEKLKKDLPKPDAFNKDSSDHG